MADNASLSASTYGLASARPTVPDYALSKNFTGTQNGPRIAYYYATDTGVYSMYANGAWINVSALLQVVNTPIVASTTQTRAGATQMTGTYNNITTVANASDAVGLPPIVSIGQQVWVTNAGANAAKVFPDSGTPGATTTIDGGSAGASVTLTNAKSALFTATTLTNWQTIGSAARVA